MHFPTKPKYVSPSPLQFTPVRHTHSHFLYEWESFRQLSPSLWEKWWPWLEACSLTEVSPAL